MQPLQGFFPPTQRLARHNDVTHFTNFLRVWQQLSTRNTHDPCCLVPVASLPWRPTSLGKRDPPRAPSCSRVGTISGGCPPPPRTSPGRLWPRRRLGRTRTRTREFRSSAGRRTFGRTRVLCPASEASRVWNRGRRDAHARRALLQDLRAGK